MGTISALFSATFLRLRLQLLSTHVDIPHAVMLSLDTTPLPCYFTYHPPVFSLRRTVCGSHFTEHRRRIKQDEMPKEAWKVEHDRSREMMASRPMPESGYR